MSLFVLVSPDAEFAQRMGTAVDGGLPGALQVLADDLPAEPEELFAALGGTMPEVLVFGPGISLDAALRFATVMDIRFPGVTMLMAAPADAELALAAMRAGVRDVVAPDIDPEQLRIVLQRGAQASESRVRTAAASEAGADGGAPRGRVIGVFSPKGGVGKTTLATNIAVGLAKAAPLRVVVVDLDLQFGDVASGLDLEPEHTITDAVTPAAARDSLVLKAFLTMHPGSFYALCAPRNPAEADSIGAEQVSHLIRQLAEQFDYVVLDTAPGLGEHTLAGLEACTDAVWVTGMDVPGVRGLRSSLQILAHLGLVPESRHLVLNMADPKVGLSVKDIEVTLGLPVDVSVPRSRTVAYSTNRGIPVLQAPRRGDKAATALGHVVECLTPSDKSRAARRSHRRVVVS
ncbi:AAA family ATPase [Sinomonas halotolerans]|uniref:AAA family ATPase n=1 Tax=Sinomonas halotolerans TaxID=1644133 RepID=A0ABU9WYG2_9MICC